MLTSEKWARLRRLGLLGHILKDDLHTHTQKAMDKYFDAPYIPNKKKYKTTLASVLENDFTCMETHSTKRKPGKTKNAGSWQKDVEKANQQMNSFFVSYIWFKMNFY